MSGIQNEAQAKLFGIIPVEPMSHNTKRFVLGAECLVGIIAANLSGGLTLAEIAAVAAVVTAAMPEKRDEIKK